MSDSRDIPLTKDLIENNSNNSTSNLISRDKEIVATKSKKKKSIT